MSLPQMPAAQTMMGNPTSEIYNRLLKDRIIILGGQHDLAARHRGKRQIDR